MKLLQRYNRTDAEALGGKAYGLWLAYSLGYPIPTTWVVEADDVSNFIPDPAVSSYAIRSCDPNEDSKNASFAGQHTSVMQVLPAREQSFIELVRRPGAGTSQYAAALGIAPAAERLNVLVQPYLEFAETGVYFSQDPDGAPGTSLLETVDGPLVHLVSGHVNPKTSKTWFRTDPRPGLQTVLTKLTMALQPYLDGALDMELGLLPTFTILQVRPLTAALKGSALAKLAIGCGRVTGRVTRRPGRNPILPDSILCTDMTDISMISDMQNALAVVTKVGGRTCHAAIVARELGLQVLIGCPDIGRFRENTKITVDFTEKCIEEVK